MRKIRSDLAVPERAAASSFTSPAIGIFHRGRAQDRRHGVDPCCAGDEAMPAATRLKTDPSPGHLVFSARRISTIGDLVAALTLASPGSLVVLSLSEFEKVFGDPSGEAHTIAASLANAAGFTYHTVRGDTSYVGFRSRF